MGYLLIFGGLRLIFNLFNQMQLTMPKTKKITFSLPAEIVADEFNNWNKEQGFSLKKSKDGSMKATIELEAGKSYEYRYLLDGGRWVNDENASAYTEVSGLGVLNCVVNVPAEASAEVKLAKKTTAKKVKTENVVLEEKAEAKPAAKRSSTKKTAK
jgi:hypothetical protein